MTSSSLSLRQPPYLPMSRREMTDLGWDELDILLISGDAYVDHPSFGVALLGRWLVAHGFRVGIAAQPSWEVREDALADLACMGRPRLFAGVTAGAIDSMLAHYTAFRKKRHDDAYTPGGVAGARPNRASIVYTGLVRQAFPGIPVVLGGIEASLRRISHYDFWADALRRPLLQDSKADLLVYGMGEYSLLAIAEAARQSLDGVGTHNTTPTAQGHTETAKLLSRADFTTACRDIPGIAWLTAASSVPELVARLSQQAPLQEAHADGSAAAAPQQSSPSHDNSGTSVGILPSHEDILQTPALLMQATLTLEQQVHSGSQHLVQVSADRALVLTPPAPALSESELDSLYSLPYSRMPHPAYIQPVPAWEMIRTSITTHRGCGGGCSFCSLALHQGRRIASRSRASIVREATAIAAGPQSIQENTAQKGKAAFAVPPRWAGSISDVGGPSANMWQARCLLPEGKQCKRASCMHPAVCPLFSVDQSKGVSLLREIAALEQVRHVRVASGVRFDLALQDNAALFAYTSEFTGGQLKVAPEHSEDTVLNLMRKPSLQVFEQFLDAFIRHCNAAGKEQYTIPYLMSAFPGCTDAHMQRLAAWLKQKSWRPQQVQCFIPTPGTVATAMFYAGITPQGERLYVARTDKDRLRQHHLLLGSEDTPEQRKEQYRARQQHTPAPPRGESRQSRYPSSDGKKSASFPARTGRSGKGKRTF